jgi:hypothetical protein
MQLNDSTVSAVGIVFYMYILFDSSFSLNEINIRNFIGVIKKYNWKMDRDYRIRLLFSIHLVETG